MDIFMEIIIDLILLSPWFLFLAINIFGGKAAFDVSGKQVTYSSKGIASHYRDFKEIKKAEKELKVMKKRLKELKRTNEKFKKNRSEVYENKKI